jgi:ATP-dependent RNA helicase DeaD
LAKEYQREAFRIEVGGDEGGHADIDYRAIRIAPGDVDHAVVNTLRFFESPSALVFCNTREAVRHLQATLSERGFSVVALSGELTQNERTHALQALRDGRARVCVATDVAARGIDLPNLDLVIHADIPNDPEVMQHRSGRTGRAGRKGVSVLLVPPARKRRAEVLLNLAGIDAIWGTAPQADEIRKLDQERMLKDALFAEETTPEDLMLAQALLAERSAEDIAAALARLYRARLPSPEDIIDPGEHRGRPREDRGRERDSRAPRGDDRASGPRSKPRKPSARHVMNEGSVWFRASIGSRKNAEARWLLPMICRRGGIDKTDIGAIRVMDTTTEFEISARAADKFVGNLRRPDKEDNIRIEPLPEGPQDQPTAEKRPSVHAAPHRPREETAPRPHGKPWQDKPRDDKPRDDKPWSNKPPGGKPREGKPYGDKPARENASGFDKERRYDTKRPFRDKPAYAAKPKHDGAARPAFGKKKKKKFRG